MNKWKSVKSFQISGEHGRYAVWLYREYEESWGYMNMRDYPTDEPVNNFRLDCVPFDSKGHACNTDAGFIYESIKTKEFDKDMANRIYLSLKNGFTYNQLLTALKKNDLVEKVGYQYHSQY